MTVIIVLPSGTGIDTWTDSLSGLWLIIQEYIDKWKVIPTVEAITRMDNIHGVEQEEWAFKIDFTGSSSR